MVKTKIHNIIHRSRYRHDALAQVLAIELRHTASDIMGSVVSLNTTMARNPNER